MKIVESTVKPQLIEFTEKEVFIASNIKEEKREDMIFYIWEEERYSKDEYLLKLQERADILENALQELIIEMG